MIRPLLLTRSALALLAVALLGACTLLPEGQTRQVYVLPIASAPAADTAARQNWTLRVEAPLVAAALNGDRIAVMPQAHRMSVYEGASWSDRVPDLLRARFVEAFRRDGRVLAVSDIPGAVPTDYALELDLHAFHSEYAGQPQPTVVVGFDARLVDRDSLRVVANRRFNAREAVAGVQVPEVVTAFGAATDRVSAELVDWAVEQGNRARAAQHR